MTNLYRNISLFALIMAASVARAAVPAFMSPYDPWMLDAPAPAVTEIEAVSADEVSIKAEGRKVHVSGAADETLEVYNIAGVKVASYEIDAPEKTITLTVPRGVYILHVGNVARKVNILS